MNQQLVQASGSSGLAWKVPAPGVSAQKPPWRRVAQSVLVVGRALRARRECPEMLEMQGFPQSPPARPECSPYLQVRNPTRVTRSCESSVRSAMFIARSPRVDQAPLGAACCLIPSREPDMPLPTQTFHAPEAGAPAFCRLTSSEWSMPACCWPRPFGSHKPATCRRSGPWSFRAVCNTIDQNPTSLSKLHVTRVHQRYLPFATCHLPFSVAAVPRCEIFRLKALEGSCSC